MRGVFTLRRWRASAHLTVFLAAMAGMWLGAGVVSAHKLLPTRSEQVASVERLLRSFERIVLGDETTEKRYGRVSKWSRPIRTAIFGTRGGKWLSVVVSDIADLTFIAGVDFQFVNPREEPHDLAVVIGKREYLIVTLRSFGTFFDPITDGMESDASIHCLGANGPSGGAFERGVVLISTEIEPHGSESCALQELVHVIGLRHHSDLIRPSIMNDGNTLVELSLNDRILIHTLYDSRIEPGMPRDEALAVAREIIAEHVEEALAKGAIAAE